VYFFPPQLHVCNDNVSMRAGTARFQKGYLAYAGAGKNSRGTQLIMSFQDNLYLGGGSPWEVPFAQVFGASSFETLGACCSTRCVWYALNELCAAVGTPWWRC
jgi:hypothetical protein